MSQNEPPLRTRTSANASTEPASLQSALASSAHSSRTHSGNQTNNESKARPPSPRIPFAAPITAPSLSHVTGSNVANVSQLRPNPSHIRTDGPPRTRSRESQLRVVGNYALDRLVGEGSYATVKLADHRLTGEKVAVKIFDKHGLDPKEDELGKIITEIHILRAADHPHIVKIFEVIETADDYYLALEYASGGELFEYIIAHEKISEKDGRRIFQQIVDAVDYLHSRRIAHRDLKPENILLDQDMNIKVIDFGMAVHVKPGQTFTERCGSLAYAAPEALENRSYTGFDVDVWSLGVILYTLLTGRFPFEDMDPKAMQAKILRGKFSVPFTLSKEARDLIRMMLVVDQKERCTLQDIKNHPWLEWKSLKLHPFTPLVPYSDAILAQMEKLGYTRETVIASLDDRSCNDSFATYMILLIRSRKQSSKAHALAQSQTQSQTQTQTEHPKMQSEKQKTTTPTNTLPAQSTLSFQIQSTNSGSTESYQSTPKNPSKSNSTPIIIAPHSTSSISSTTTTTTTTTLSSSSSLKTPHLPSPSSTSTSLPTSLGDIMGYQHNQNTSANTSTNPRPETDFQSPKSALPSSRGSRPSSNPRNNPYHNPSPNPPLTKEPDPQKPIHLPVTSSSYTPRTTFSSPPPLPLYHATSSTALPESIDLSTPRFERRLAKKSQTQSQSQVHVSSSSPSSNAPGTHLTSSNTSIVEEEFLKSVLAEANVSGSQSIPLTHRTTSPMKPLSASPFVPSFGSVSSTNQPVMTTTTTTTATTSVSSPSITTMLSPKSVHHPPSQTHHHSHASTHAKHPSPPGPHSMEDDTENPVIVSSGKTPEGILAALFRVFDKYSVSHQNETPTRFQCVRNETRFRVEIHAHPGTKGLYRIVMHLTRGHSWAFKEVATEICFAVRQ